MNYQTLNLIGIILLCLCGLLLIISILLFIRFRIISIIGDLTGRTAKIQVEKMRSRNDKAGVNKTFNPSPFNKSRGKLTEPITLGLGKSKNTGKLAQTDSAARMTEKTHFGIEKLEQIKTETLAVTSNDTNSTVLLNHETEILNRGTEVLQEGTMLLNTGTEVLTEAVNSSVNESQNEFTTVLTEGTQVLSDSIGLAGGNDITDSSNTFLIKKSITLIHTSEVI